MNLRMGVLGALVERQNGKRLTPARRSLAKRNFVVFK